MKTFKAKVRKDGAINIGAKNRTIAGITPGMELDVQYQHKTGILAIKPLGYTCSVCGKQMKSPLDSFGYCTACNELITELIMTKKAPTVAEAVAKTAVMRGAKVVKK